MRRFKSVLCVLEHGKPNQRALERSVALAENNQAALTVVDVIPAMGGEIDMPVGGRNLGDVQAAMVGEREEGLASLVRPYSQRLDIQCKVLHGTSFLEVIREVLRNAHDLVIKCPESPDWLDRLFSGDDMHLLRKCPCPVWLVKPESAESFQSVLAAVDVNDSYPPEELDTRHALNSLILEIASSLAVSEFAELHVVHAWEAIGEGAMRRGAFVSQPEDEVDAYVEQVRQHHARRLDELMGQAGTYLGADAMEYLKPRLHLLKGPARKEIPSLAERLQVDCIVMGTVARTGVRGFFMGNTAETILEQIHCSVLAIKPPGFVTPVTLEE